MELNHQNSDDRHRPLIPLTFKPITPEQTTQLRQLVLWPTISLDKQLIPSYDFEESTIHLGAFLAHIEDSFGSIIPKSLEKEYISGQNPIGILTLAEQPYPIEEFSLPFDNSFPERLQIQLHKFAIHPSLQGKSIGRHLLPHAINTLKKKYPHQQILFHFDARINQRQFYEKCGMILLDEKSFWKFGSTGKEEGVEYVKMGKVI